MGVSQAALPSIPDCQAAQDNPFSTDNPTTYFDPNHEIALKATPQRVGSLRQQGPLPTGHFATNHIKLQQIWPMILTPYQALLKPDGAVYDAYTMERWSDPERTNYMEQQSAWEAGRPWNKLNDMGSNLRQMTSGPDGNKMSAFNGNSGVQIRIAGLVEPEMTSFGELYANFIYNSGGGSMEIPLVRGAALMTHILKSANPVVKPFCLAGINGQSESFDCPQEPSTGDGGVGFIEGFCGGSTLTITLHNSQVVKDFTMVQWAAEQKSNWGNRVMRNCDSSHCALQDGGKTVKITVPNVGGTMNFAVNYIGHYLLPPDWANNPEEVTCSRKRDVNDISLTAHCSSSREVTITVDMATETFPGLENFQYALEDSGTWTPGYTPGMHPCTPAVCQQNGNTVVIRAQSPGANYKLAVNIIGTVVLPRQDWINSPYTGTCDGSTITDGGSSSSGTSTGTQAPSTGNQPLNPTYTVGNINDANTKFILELNEPGSDLPGQTRKFILYFSSPVVAKIDRGAQEITFEPQGGGRYSGLLQLAYAGVSPRGNGAQVSYFDQYAGVYSYQPRVRYCVSDSRNKGYVSFEWNPRDASGGAASGDKLLMVTMPHHALLIDKTEPGSLRDTPFTFKGYVGRDWLLEHDVLHTEVDPDIRSVANVKANQAQLQDILAAIDRDAQNQNLDSICDQTDSYNGGKGIGMVTRLASLSRAFGTNHYQSLDNSIKNCLEKWLRIQDTLNDMWKFHYDDVWGGLFLRATGNPEIDWGVDYGFPYFNDHHFHLGYFIYAMAYYVKYYPSWGATHKNRVYSLARDVGNPSSRDAFFPVSRQKDIYTGFSWASGLVPGTRQEESASEGINCYHGLAALGDAYGDKNLKQTGQILLAMEVHSVREYWQVRGHNRDHFPPAIRDFGVVGMITEPDFYAYTLNWPCDPNIFPQRHACLVGIQVIPITSVSKYWMDAEWAASIRQSCEWAINPNSAPSYAIADKSGDLSKTLSSGWQAFCYAAMAPLDSAHATAAANYVKDKRPQELVGGTGAASTLLFIYGGT